MERRPRLASLITLPIAALALGCGPAIAGGAQAASPDPDAPEPAEEQLAIVQASHTSQRTFVAQGTRSPAVRAIQAAGGFTTPDVAAPTTAAVLDGPVMGHDPQVAVGDRFLIVYGSHKYQVLDKATGKPLAAEPGDAVAPSGEFNGIFAPVWHPRDLAGTTNDQNINTRLRFGDKDKLACDHEAPTKSNACVQEFYDTRVLWDGLRKRFWIESAARNHLWFCNDRGPCDEGPTSTQTRTQARRYIAVAVSRTEDPRQGFHHYVLVDEYADWPKIGLHDRYLILGHRASPNVYVFDADRLAAGNPDHAPVRVAKLGARSFPGAKWIAPVNHLGPSTGVTWLMGSDGSNEIVPFALVNPSPDRAARPIVVAGPRVATRDKVFTLATNPVFRSGFLHFVRDVWAPGHEKEYRELRVIKVPLQLVAGAQPSVWAANDPKRGFLEAVIGGREPDDAASDVIDYEMPALSVNGAGDVVVAYSRKGYKTATELAPEVRYSILYHQESRARPGVLVRRGTTSAVPDINDNGKAGIDLADAQVDPSDDHTVWITNAWADGRARWYRQVVAAVKP